MPSEQLAIRTRPETGHFSSTNLSELLRPEWNSPHYGANRAGAVKKLLIAATGQGLKPDLEQIVVEHQRTTYRLVGPFSPSEPSEEDHNFAFGIQENKYKSRECGQKYHAIWYKISLENGTARFVTGVGNSRSPQKSEKIQDPYGYNSKEWENNEGSPPWKHCDLRSDGMCSKPKEGSKATETEVETWIAQSAPGERKKAETKSQGKSKESRPKRKREGSEGEGYMPREEDAEGEDGLFSKGAGMSGDDKLAASDKSPATPPDTEEEARKRAMFNTNYPAYKTDTEVWHAFSTSKVFDKDLKKNVNSHADQHGTTWRIWKGFASRWKRFLRDRDTETLVYFTEVRRNRDLNETTEFYNWLRPGDTEGAPLVTEINGVKSRPTKADDASNDGSDDLPSINPNLPRSTQAHIRTQRGLRHLRALNEGGRPAWQREMEEFRQRKKVHLDPLTSRQHRPSGSGFKGDISGGLEGGHKYPKDGHD